MLEDLCEPPCRERCIERKACRAGLLHPDHRRQEVGAAFGKHADEDVRANAPIGKAIGDGATAMCEVAIAE